MRAYIADALWVIVPWMDEAGNIWERKYSCRWLTPASEHVYLPFSDCLRLTRDEQHRRILERVFNLEHTLISYEVRMG